MENKNLSLPSNNVRERKVLIMEGEVKTYTEEELKQLLADKEAELLAKHNSEMATQRQKAKDEKDKAVAKAVEEASLSAEDRARKNAEEQAQAQAQEIATLKAFKKETELKQALKDASVPEIFINDRRLHQCSDSEVASVIQTIKAEYEKTLPNGSRTNTNVATPTNNKGETDKFAEFRNAGIDDRKSR